MLRITNPLRIYEWKQKQYIVNREKKISPRGDIFLNHYGHDPPIPSDEKFVRIIIYRALCQSPRLIDRVEQLL